MVLKALEMSGHEVQIASRFRSYEGKGDHETQKILAEEGNTQAQALLDSANLDQADLWLTYHNYHKAPDHLGPAISEALGIPYVIIEGSLSARQKEGPWHHGWASSFTGLKRADHIFAMSPKDLRGLIDHGLDPERLTVLAPFIDCDLFDRDGMAPDQRKAWAESLSLDPAKPWIVTVAMMRDDQKWRSYEVAIKALSGMTDRSFQWIIVGDGPMRAALETRLAQSGLATRTRLTGKLDKAQIADLLHVADIMIWPAIKEAVGLVLMEAQASKCAVIAGHTSGTSSIVDHGVTGLLTEEGDDLAMRRAISDLLADPAGMKKMGQAGREKMRAGHDIRNLAATLDQRFRKLVASGRQK